MIIEVGDETGRCAIDASVGGRLRSLILNGRERLLGEPAEGVESSVAWGCLRLLAGGRNDTGLVSLGAGERLRASTTWSWTPRPAPPAGVETVQGSR